MKKSGTDAITEISMILLFSSIYDDYSERITKVVRDLLPSGWELESFHNIEDLSERLHRPRKGLAIAVLLSNTPDDLAGLLSLKDLFKDIQIILIVPDANSDTMINGYKLYPRYVGYKNGDLSEIVLVLAKMIKKHESREPGGA